MNIIAGLFIFSIGLVVQYKFDWIAKIKNTITKIKVLFNRG